MKKIVVVFLCALGVLYLTIAGLGLAGCGSDRIGNAPGVQAHSPFSVDAQRQRLAPQAVYVATAVCPDGKVEIYSYSGTRRMHWIIWRNADTAAAFDVWPSGDSLATDQPLLSWGSWWKCIRTWSNSCSDRYPNDNTEYLKCIAGAVSGCAIGSAIAWVYLDSWNWW